MKYQLAYTRRAVKDIQKLDADNKERIGKLFSGMSKIR